MSAGDAPTIHATTVAIAGRAVAIRGPSGAGKSDLALRLIDRGAVLIADDRTILTRAGRRLIARCPPVLAGMIEIRGIGIVPCPATDAGTLALFVDIGDEPRMPEPRLEEHDGIAVPVVVLDARAPSAAIKVERALALVTGAGR